MVLLSAAQESPHSVGLHKKKTPRFREGLLGEMAGFNPPWWHSYFAGACCCPCAGAGVVEPEAS